MEKRKYSQPPQQTSTPRPCRNTLSLQNSFDEVSPILPVGGKVRAMVPMARSPLKKTSLIVELVKPAKLDKENIGERIGLVNNMEKNQTKAHRRESKLSEIYSRQSVLTSIPEVPPLAEIEKTVGNLPDVCILKSPEDQNCVPVVWHVPPQTKKSISLKRKSNIVTTGKKGLSSESTNTQRHEEDLFEDVENLSPLDIAYPAKKRKTFVLKLNDENSVEKFNGNTSRKSKDKSDNIQKSTYFPTELKDHQKNDLIESSRAQDQKSARKQKQSLKSIVDTENSVEKFNGNTSRKSKDRSDNIQKSTYLPTELKDHQKNDFRESSTAQDQKSARKQKQSLKSIVETESTPRKLEPTGDNVEINNSKKLLDVVAQNKMICETEQRTESNVEMEISPQDAKNNIENRTNDVLPSNKSSPHTMLRPSSLKKDQKLITKMPENVEENIANSDSENEALSDLRKRPTTRRGPKKKQTTLSVSSKTCKATSNIKTEELNEIGKNDEKTNTDKPKRGRPKKNTTKVNSKVAKTNISTNDLKNQNEDAEPVLNTEENAQNNFQMLPSPAEEVSISQATSEQTKITKKQGHRTSQVLSIPSVQAVDSEVNKQNIKLQETKIKKLTKSSKKSVQENPSCDEVESKLQSVEKLNSSCNDEQIKIKSKKNVRIPKGKQKSKADVSKPPDDLGNLENKKLNMETASVKQISVTDNKKRSCKSRKNYNEECNAQSTESVVDGPVCLSPNNKNDRKSVNTKKRLVKNISSSSEDHMNGITSRKMKRKLEDSFAESSEPPAPETDKKRLKASNRTTEKKSKPSSNPTEAPETDLKPVKTSNRTSESKSKPSSKPTEASVPVQTKVKTSNRTTEKKSKPSSNPNQEAHEVEIIESDNGKVNSNDKLRDKDVSECLGSKSNKVTKPSPGVEMEVFIHKNGYVMTGCYSVHSGGSITSASTDTAYFVTQGAATVRLCNTTKTIRCEDENRSFFIPKCSDFSITNGDNVTLKMMFTKFRS